MARMEAALTGHRTLYFHAGPHKTATSAVQHLMRDGAIAAVHYPAVGQWGDGAHHDLVFAFFDSARRQPGAAPFAALLDELAAAVAADPRDVVISSEFLSVEPDAAGFIDAVAERLAPLIGDIRVVMVFRDYMAWFASLYNQRVKDPFDAETRHPDDYLREVARTAYRPMVERLSGRYPLEALAYEPRATVVERVIARLGGDDAGPLQHAERNVSIAVEWLMVLLAANRALADAGERAAFFEAVRRRPGFHGRSQRIFSDAAWSEVMPLLIADRDFLASRLPGLDPLPSLEATGANAFGLTGLELDQLATELDWSLGEKASTVTGELARLVTPSRIDLVIAKEHPGVSMNPVEEYLRTTFKQVEGWCIPDLWQAIAPLRQLLAEEGPEGPIAEIGVYQGKFFIGLVKTMGAAAHNTAIDVFDLQRFNLDGAGVGNLEAFRANLARAGVAEQAVDMIRTDSMSFGRPEIEALRARTQGFTMFSVDGCHMVEHTLNDVAIAMELTRPYGIIFVDDYYNPNWPGVQEGIAKLYLTSAPRFVPLLFTCNKLFLCNLSYHAKYLKAVVAWVRERHPASRVKMVKRFGYDTVTIMPSPFY